MHPLTKTICLIIIATLFSSCATKKLWEATDPSYYVMIPTGSITEDELKQKGLKYYKDYKENAYYVEKTELYKFRDYSLRLFGAPVTVVVDAATVIVVAGILVYLIEKGSRGGLEYDCNQDISCQQQKRR